MKKKSQLNNLLVQIHKPKKYIFLVMKVVVVRVIIRHVYSNTLFLSTQNFTCSQEIWQI